jgi:hypothetical protein
MQRHRVAKIKYAQTRNVNLTTEEKDENSAKEYLFCIYNGLRILRSYDDVDDDIIFMRPWLQYKIR